MRIAASVLLVSLLPALSGIEAQDKKKPAEKKPLVVPLTKAPIKKGMLRPGYDFKAEIPDKAYQAKIGSDVLFFLDLDNNDEITPGTDGIAMPAAGPFVVLLSDALLLKTGQYKLTFEGTKQVTLTAEDLGAAQKYVPDASLFTEIRLRAGLRTAVLDPQMCLDCDKHTDYLKMNGAHLQDQGKTNPHLEDSSKPGYTAEGETAGRASNVFKERTDLRKAILSWYTTPYHGAAMMIPATDKIGLTNKNNVCMLYFSNYMQTFGEPYVHPPDGAIEIPTSLGNGEDGENPNPVPGTQNGRGCGFPIVVKLNGRYSDTESAEVVDGAGRPVQGSWSTPMKPANKVFPDNIGCVFFVPAKPLSPKTAYKVTIKFPGGDKPLSWSFTTGAK